MAPTWRSFKGDDGLTGRALNLCRPTHNATSQMCRYTRMKTQTQSRPSYFFLQRKHKASLEHTHSLYSTATGLPRASNQHASHEQNTGQMYSRGNSWMLIFNTLLTTTYSWFTIYLNPASFKTRDSCPDVPAINRSISKSADVSSCFSEGWASDMVSMAYGDHVSHPMWPHQIIMQSKNIKPTRAVLGMKINCFAAVWIPGKSTFLGDIQSVFSMGFDLHSCRWRVLQEAGSRSWGQGS